MNQLKYIVHSLPRYTATSNAISAVSSGSQINAQSIVRHSSDYLRVNLPSNQPAPFHGFTRYGQTLLRGKPKITLTYRNESSGRIGHQTTPHDNKKSDDRQKVLKAEASDKNEKRVQQLVTITEPRNYAKLIADYSEAMEKRNLESKSKEWPTGLLSRLPIESLVSSPNPFKKNRKIFKSKLKKRDSFSRVAKTNVKRSNRALAKNDLETENKKNSMTTKSAPQIRDYFTENCDAKKLENKIKSDNSDYVSSVPMNNAYVPNDFHIICDLTEKHQQENNHAERSNFGGIADHKAKDLRNLTDDFKLSDPTLNDNESQFDIVTSDEKIELKLSSPDISKQRNTSRWIAKDQRSVSSTFVKSNITQNIPKPQKSTYKYNQKNNPLPWWTIPDSILNQKYDKADRTSSNSTPEIQVIYSEELFDTSEIAKRKKKGPPSQSNSKSNQPEKLANLSKTKQYIKEELEKHRDKQRKAGIDKLTNIDGEQVEEGKRRSINERSDDKTATLSRMIDRKIETMVQGVVIDIPVFQATNKKSEQNNTSAIPEASKMQTDQARKSSIHQAYCAKRVTEPLKPLEKKKDGTLIDYGLKVPTRRPKKKQPVTSERNPEKKNSAPHHRQQQVDRKSVCSIPRQIASSSQQQLLILGKSDENEKINNLKTQSLDLRRSNCSGEAIAERLVNSLPQQLKSEQMFRPRRDSCHSNCRLSTCAADSTISAYEARPEKQLIYAAWLNRLHTPRHLLF